MWLSCLTEVFCLSRSQTSVRVAEGHFDNSQERFSKTPPNISFTIAVSF